MSSRNGDRGVEKECEEEEKWSEKCLFKSRRKSPMILRRCKVRIMNFIVFTRSLTEFYFPINKNTGTR